MPRGSSWFSTGWQQRLVLALLRRLKPILFVGTRIPGWVVLTRHGDVLEALARDDAFSPCLAEQRMRETLGPFFLGMDDTPRYRREWAAAHDCIRQGDLDRIRTLAATVAGACVEKARPYGSIDVVAGLAEIVHLRYAADYYGLPSRDDPDPGAVLRAYRSTTFYTFNWWIGGAFEIAAVEGGKFLQDYIARQMAARRSTNGTGPDDFMGRLLDMQKKNDPNALDDDAVRTTIGGVVSGSLEPGIGMFVRAIDQLMFLPAASLGRVQRAAREDDDETVLGYVLEGSRFNPYPPFLYRYCTEDFLMAPGTRRKRTIPKGATVVAVLASAMLDSHAVPSPCSFKPGRPDATYVNFGHGQHLCIGKAIAEILLVEMAKAVLRLRGLKRAPGKNGQLATGTPGTLPDGYYTEHLILEFEP
jgi:cytochrome P450